MGIWLKHQVRNVWWWLRGVDLESYTMRCDRCGHNGRIHLAGGGCWRYAPPVADRQSRRRRRRL